MKRQAKKAQKEKAAAAKPSVPVNKSEEASNGNGFLDSNLTEEEKLVQRLEHDLDLNAKARAVTGVLGVSPKSRDIKIDNFSIMFHGYEILTDTKLELNCGQRYGKRAFCAVLQNHFLFERTPLDSIRNSPFASILISNSSSSNSLDRPERLR